MVVTERNVEHAWCIAGHVLSTGSQHDHPVFIASTIMSLTIEWLLPVLLDCYSQLFM